MFAHNGYSTGPPALISYKLPNSCLPGLASPRPAVEDDSVPNHCIVEPMTPTSTPIAPTTLDPWIPYRTAPQHCHFVQTLFLSLFRSSSIVLRAAS